METMKERIHNWNSEDGWVRGGLVEKMPPGVIPEFDPMLLFLQNNESNLDQFYIKRTRGNNFILNFSYYYKVDDCVDITLQIDLEIAARWLVAAEEAGIELYSKKLSILCWTE